MSPLRVLSGLVTFHCLLQSLELLLPFPLKITLLCDNKSVVNKITSCTELRRTVNQHRHPDVDIEMQVLHEISQLEAKSCIIFVQHVRGHQDTKNQKKFLSMEEQLNVTADELTHRARTLPDQKHHHPFPVNPVNFIINNKYINFNYPRMVNSAYHSIALLEYFSNKHGWFSATIDSIW
jgi:hypothetical protein